MDAFVGLGSEYLALGQKKGKDPSSLVSPKVSLFDHASNTQRVQMSHRTDRYAHRTIAPSESWPGIYNQCDVDL